MRELRNLTSYDEYIDENFDYENDELYDDEDLDDVYEDDNDEFDEDDEIYEKRQTARQKRQSKIRNKLKSGLLRDAKYKKLRMEFSKERLAIAKKVIEDEGLKTSALSLLKGMAV